MSAKKQSEKNSLNNFWLNCELDLPEQAPLNFHTLNAMTESKELIDMARFSQSDFHQTSTHFVDLHHKPISKMLIKFPKK